MKEKRERLQAIEARKLELRSDLENSEKDINLEEVNTELDTLNAEEVQIKEEIKVEEETRSNLVKGFDKGFKKVEEPLEKKGKNMEQENIFESKEYRAGFLKQLQGKKLNEVEERAMTSAADSVGVMVPTVTQDLIMKQVEQSAPLLQEIELLRVNGNVTFAIEADATDANVHVEGATITEDGDVLIPVSLSSYEILSILLFLRQLLKCQLMHLKNG